MAIKLNKLWNYYNYSGNSFNTTTKEYDLVRIENVWRTTRNESWDKCRRNELSFGQKTEEEQNDVTSDKLHKNPCSQEFKDQKGDWFMTNSTTRKQSFWLPTRKPNLISALELLSVNKRYDFYERWYVTVIFFTPQTWRKAQECSFRISQAMSSELLAKFISTYFGHKNILQ